MPITDSQPAGDSASPVKPRVHVVPTGTLASRKPVQVKSKDGADVTLASVAEDTPECDDVPAEDATPAVENIKSLPVIQMVPSKAVSAAQVSEVSSTSSSDAEEQPATKIIKIDLYRPECTRCGHLTITATKTWDNCHFTNGNDDCPAAVLQLRVSVSKTKVAQKLAQYQFDADVEGYNRASNKLTEAVRTGGVTTDEFKSIKRKEGRLLKRLEAQAKEAKHGHSSSKHKSSSSKRR